MQRRPGFKAITNIYYMYMYDIHVYMYWGCKCTLLVIQLPLLTTCKVIRQHLKLAMYYGIVCKDNNNNARDDHINYCGLLGVI